MDVMEELWEEHHKMIQQFEDFMSDLTVNSPPLTPVESIPPVITPEHIRADRRWRRFEMGIKDLFKSKPLDEAKADREFRRSVKPNPYMD